MCGILGSVNLRLGPECLDLLAHRGPDGQGHEAFAVGQHQVALAHRRLSIVDLSPAGKQPMVTTCGGYAIVYNGEIYNHQDLRANMPQVLFRGHSDTETCLNCLAANGIRGLASFNGIFAIGFLNVRERKLFLARDPFGVKPLYYWVQPGRVMFSSELRPIQECVHETIDLENLAELLRLRYSPSPDTLFRNIRKVRPGHIVEVDLSGDAPVITEYCFSKPPEPIAKLSFEEAQRRYGELLDRAVERQLMSDVEVGMLLSGGVDSALIAAIAQRHSSYRMKAFTVGFHGASDADEVEDAAETARTIGLDHFVVRMGPADFFDDVRKCVSFVEEPLATTSLVPMFHLARCAASHVKVVLSGQGADEAMGGYRRYQLELLRRFLPPIGGVRAAGLMSTIGVRNDAVLRGIRALAERDPLRRILDAHTVFSTQEIQGLIGIPDTQALNRIKYFYDLLGCAERTHPVEAMMSLDLRTALPDDLLLYTDKITMRHSIECRVPLLDHDLVRFVESLPYRYRLRVQSGKIIHKCFAETLLPANIIKRKKKGFLSPTNTWFRDPGPLRETLLSRDSAFASFFDLKIVAHVLAEHESGFDRSRQIFLLLSIYYWISDVYRPEFCHQTVNSHLSAAGLGPAT
jgi:asparagine synthase (glutamine-hydrolysing)